MTRGRRPNLERSLPLNLMLPESLRTKIDILLYSELEGRVPRGKYQEFFIGLLTKHFSELKESKDANMESN